MTWSRGFSRLRSILIGCRRCSSTTRVAAVDVANKAKETRIASVKIRHRDLDVADEYTDKPLKPTFNVAAYADKVEVLQKLMDMGVEVHTFDNDPALCKHILGLDFVRDVQPHVRFLYRHGVPASRLGYVITKNPHLLREELDNLRVRINYMESKNFTAEMIGEIITRNPRWLSLSVVEMDSRLGYLQKEFKLKGSHVRQILTGCPGVGTVRKEVLLLNAATLKKEFELEAHDVRSMLLKAPYILIKDNSDLVRVYTYLIRNMCIPIELVVAQPEVFNSRVHLINLRNNFLKRLGRAQYNPKLPGYVSLKDLVQCNDEEFCKRIALTDVKIFDEFIKLS